METELEENDDDLLLVSDTPCSKEAGYAWSEGGDSLLDSEKDSEGEEDECLEIHPPVSHVSTPSQECNTHTPQKLPQPSLLLQPASDQPSQSQSEAHPSPLRSRVIRLDGQKKFRYVPECLPDVPLPKRVSSWSRPAFTRPRRLTKPSLLLEPKRSLLTSDLLPDLRNTLVANRMAMDSHREIGVVGRTGVRERGEAKVLSSAMYSEGAYTHSLSYSWKISALSCTSVASVPQSITSAASVLQVKDDHVTMPSIAQRGPPSATPPTAHHSLCGRTPHTSENLTHTHASGSHWACDSWSGSAASSETTSTKNISSFTTSPHPTSTTGLFERRPTFSVQATPLPSTSFPPLHPPPSLPLQRADHVQPINPFYAKMPQHQPDESFNPFILALEKEAVMKAEQAAVKERTCHSDPFSFSLAHITRYM